MGEGESGGEGEGTLPGRAGEDHLLDGPYGKYDPRPGAYGDGDLGGGPYIEDLGIREWYLPPNSPQAQQPGKSSVHWQDILTHWNAVESDLHDTFGVDVESGILAQRSWRWLNLRILDLINQPSRLRRALNLTSETTRS